MKKYLTIEKELGETPLEALDRLRQQEALAESVPLAYAGRLDPMASGKLLVLVGDECKRQSRYHSLDKEYEFEVLLGIESDTGDILGLTETSGSPSMDIHEVDIQKVISSLRGTISFPYPTFSSKTVRGKPLFLWTLEKRLDEIEIPIATTTLYSLTYQGSFSVSKQELFKTVEERIGKITPVTAESKALGEDFRRIPILDKWKKNTEETPQPSFQVLRFKTTCSSGTYIRSLAPHIAKLLGATGLAYRIHRTKIGHYLPIPLIGAGIWTRSF